MHKTPNPCTTASRVATPKCLHVCCVHYPQCSPDLFLALLFVERAQDTARSVSNSCQSRGIAGTFDPSVSQNVDWHPLDAREKEQCLGPQGKGSRCRQRRLFLNSDPETSYRGAQKDSAKHVTNTIADHRHSAQHNINNSYHR